MSTTCRNYAGLSIAERLRPAIAASLALYLACAWQSVAAQDSRFTYQGQLKRDGQLLDGTPDLEFRLYDQLQGGNQIGPSVARPDVPVAGGLFSVDIDFGSAAFRGGQRWIETRVDGQALSPRQAVNAVPIAGYALSGPDGTGAASIQFPGDRLYAGVPLASTSDAQVLLASGITGDSAAAAGGIDVLSYSVSALGPVPSVGGSGTGRPTFGELRVLLRADRAVPVLYTRLIQGLAIATTRIDVLRAASPGAGEPLARLCLQEVKIASISQLSRAGVLEVAFNYTRIGGRQYSGPAGGPAQVATWGYDLVTNSAWAPPADSCPN